MGWHISLFISCQSLSGGSLYFFIFRCPKKVAKKLIVINELLKKVDSKKCSYLLTLASQANYYKDKNKLHIIARQDGTYNTKAKLRKTKVIAVQNIT